MADQDDGNLPPVPPPLFLPPPEPATAALPAGLATAAERLEHATSAVASQHVDEHHPTTVMAVYRRILADIETGALEGTIWSTRKLDIRYEQAIDPLDIKGALFLLAADGHLRPKPGSNLERPTFEVGEPQPGEPQFETVVAIAGIRADKARNSDDERHLDLYRVPPNREELAARYGVSNHALREAANLEFPGLPFGCRQAAPEELNPIANPRTKVRTRFPIESIAAGEVHSVLVSHLRKAIFQLRPRDRLPSPVKAAEQLGVSVGQITRVYAALTDEGSCTAASSGGGTFVARRDAQDRPDAGDYDRHALRTLLADDVASGALQLDGPIGSMALLRTRWADRGYTFTAKQVSRTLLELVAEGSAVDRGAGSRPMWVLLDSPSPQPPPRAASPVVQSGAVRRLAEQLRKRIDDGAWRPGDVLPVRRDLAAELGVAESTVGKALQLLRIQGRLAMVRSRRQQVPYDTASRYFVPLPGVPDPADAGQAWQLVEQIEAAIDQGRFAADAPATHDAVWPDAPWFAERFGVGLKTASMVLAAYGMGGWGANQRHDDTLTIPLRAFRTVKSRRNQTVGNVVAELNRVLARYPQAGLRLPPTNEIAGKLGVSHTKLEEGVRALGGRIVSRKGENGGHFTVSDQPTPTPPRLRPAQQLSPFAAAMRGHALPSDSSDPIARARQYSKQALLVAINGDGLDLETAHEHAPMVADGIHQAVADVRAALDGGRSASRHAFEQLRVVVSGVAPLLEWHGEAGRLMHERISAARFAYDVGLTDHGRAVLEEHLDEVEVVFRDGVPLRPLAGTPQRPMINPFVAVPPAPSDVQRFPGPL